MPLVFSFPIPSSLQDLEREPYNLEPYPRDFDEYQQQRGATTATTTATIDDAASRADSFQHLIQSLQQGNRNLRAAGGAAFATTQEESQESQNSTINYIFNEKNNDDDDEQQDEDDAWMDRERVQNLYTLVRKSTSLSRATRENLIETICDAVEILADILQHAPDSPQPRAFREAFACHLYMLFQIMFITESESAANAQLGVGSTGTGGTTRGGGSGAAKNKNNNTTNKKQSAQEQKDPIVHRRLVCAEAMVTATTAMAEKKHLLWKRGVPDEAVVLLPVRIAFVMLERATGVLARKAACADAAMQMIATIFDAFETTCRTFVVAGLLDLMHNQEHMASITAELCSLSSSFSSSDRLAVELLREYGRLDGSGTELVKGAGSGTKHVAPFVSELASRKPRWVLQQASHILVHFQSESYSFRSALVTAIGHILEYLHRESKNENGDVFPPPSSLTSTMEDSDDSSVATTTTTAPPLDIQKARTTLLDLLSQRIYDVSSYTRSTALKAWINLVAAGALPKERVLAVTKMAMDRLHDKTVMVRKQALHLLSSLLENNPYMGSLDPEPYRRKLNELYDEIIEKMPEHIKEAQEASRKEAQEANDEDALQALEQAALATIMEEVEDWQRHHADELTPEQQDYRSKVQALSFTQSTLDFIETFEEATCNLEGMLLSANTSDVTAALRFFVQASHFQLPCAVTGMKRALALMWSSEQAIRDEVLKAFADVFLEKPGPEGNQRLSDKQIANNLLVLTGQASVSEMASIEEAITRLVKDDRIPVNVFLFLWSIASKGSGNARVAALQLLSMGAGADRTIVDSKSRLKALLEAGFGEHARDSKDWRLVAAAATALQRIERAKVDVTDAKFLVLERIMDELCSVARGEWCQDDVENDTLQWFSVAEQVIKAIFVISPQPETACAEIIRGMHATTFVEGESQCHSLRLARFFHVLGQIAMNLLVYTEALASSVRHANAKKTLKKQEEADRAKTQNRAFGAQQESDDEEDAIEAELGMAAEVEAENERKLAEISEEEILGRGLINVFVPLLVRVVGNEGGRFTSEILMQAAMLALCKFMCVSSSFCEKHLPLLFTALGNAPSEDITMRANTIIALGDLAFRFPNEVEPYTPRIYACLRDPSTKVRRHTMMVLTHLILNDMVKVKGNVCEIAVCLRDDDHRIRDMSRLLFHELSKRSNNPVYNLLPDIVSQLSQLDGYKEEFRGIMSFLLAYIKKDRQNESLTEKFVQRFAKCTTVSQKADLAYCLALLKLNERSIKYLSDNFKLYKEALFDDDVKKSFSSIVFKAKKSAKPEMKQFLEEWEAKLQEMAEVSAENQQAGKKAAKARARASRKVARKKQKQLAAIDEDEDDEDNGDDCASKEEGADEVEEEEQEDDDFDFGKENTPKKESRKTKSTRKQSSRRGRRAAATLS